LLQGARIVRTFEAHRLEQTGSHDLRSKECTVTSSQFGEHRFESQRFQTPRVVRRRPRGRRPPLAENPVRREFGAIGASLAGIPVEIPGLTFAEPAAPAEPSFAEWFREHILPTRRMTFFVAFYLHWIALICLAAIFFRGPEEFPPIVLDATFTEELPTSDDFVQVIDTELTVVEPDPAEVSMETSETLAAVSAATAVPMPEQPLVDVPVGILALASNTADSAAKGDSTDKPHNDSRQVSLPKNAVTAGSFAVWTVPDNPAPGEPYKIVIQIRLPEKTEKYSVADLEGIVIGSDGYQKRIPGSVRGFLPVNNGLVRFEVHVVSADARVEDTVIIKSKMLREAQRLQIRF